MMQLRSIPQRHRVLPLAALVLSAGVTASVSYATVAGGQSGSVRSGTHSTQGYLGVDIHDITDEQVNSLKLQNAHGAVIAGMDHDGPACKSGLQVHDVILQMDGQAIEDEQQLRRMLRETTPGKQVSFLVSRDGQQRTVTAQMANREEVERNAWQNRYVVPDPWSDSPNPTTSASAPAPAPVPAPVPKRGNSFLHSAPAAASGAIKEAHSFLGTSMIVSPAYTGAKLEVMGPQLAEFFGAQGSAGLLVREVDPASPASDAGLKAGDVVVKVNSQEIANGSDWSKTIHENRGKPVDVLIVRDKKQQTLSLIPDSKKRSSVDSDMSIEEFFGNSDQAVQTRATLAELAPIFDVMAASMRQQMEENRSIIDPGRMMAILHFWSPGHDTRREIETAQQQLHAAARAARFTLPSVDFHENVVATRFNLD